MEQLNNAIKTNKNKCLILRERDKIEYLLKLSKNTKEISIEIEKSIRIIQREIKRGKVQEQNSNLEYYTVYKSDYAQHNYEKNSINKGRNLKINNDHELANHIESKIADENYSSDVVIGEIERKGLEYKTKICTKTLYNYIDNEIFLRISNKNLPVKSKKKY